MLLTALMTACFPPVVLRTINVSADNALHYKVLFCKVKRVVFCKVQSSCKVFICRFCRLCTSEVSCEKCCHTSNNSRKSVAALQTLCSAVIFRTLHTVFGSQWERTAEPKCWSSNSLTQEDASKGILKLVVPGCMCQTIKLSNY